MSLYRNNGMARIKQVFYIIFILFILFFVACAGEEKSLPDEKIIKIGTTKEGFKSASLLGDTFLSLFARISNPPMMTMDEDGNLRGLVVARHEVSEDCTRWKFYCHPDLYWSDGLQVTAEDVRYSIELFARWVPHARWLREIIGRTYISGDNALVLELKRPYSRLDFDFAAYNILPKHIWEKIDDPLRYTGPAGWVGCGPFIIERIDLNAGLIRFNKNPCWKGERPELERMELHLYNSTDVLAFALEKGEVDTYYRYASSYPYPNIERLKATGEFDFIEEPHLGLRFLGFNLDKKPMSDLRFREAIGCAIDYEEIIKLEVLGYGDIPSRGFIPPIMPAFKETTTLTHDKERARSLLTQAGYIDRDGDGFRETPDRKEMRLSLLISTGYVRLAELVTDHLRETGIDVQLKTVDYNTWISMKDKKNYDLVVSRTTPWGMLMHANWATGYFDARRTGEGVLHNVNDSRFQKLCDAILATKDDDRLREYASQVQDYYSLFLPAIALFWSRTVIPVKKKITGWTPNPLYGMYNVQNFLSLRIR